MAYAVLLCLAGAGLALLAANRVWTVEVVSRPVPLPELHTSRTGADLLPWLPAVALVGLAGSGAVLATAGWVRRLVGGLLLLVGLGLAVGAGRGLTAVDPGGDGPAWPLICLAGGLAIATSGLATAARGQHWPTMGARYERGTRRTGRVASAAGGDGAARTGPAEGVDRDGADRDGVVVAGARRTVEAWEALDRGEDPTVSRPVGRDRRD